MTKLLLRGVSLALLGLSTACSVAPAHGAAAAPPLQLGAAPAAAAPKLADGIGSSYTIAKLGTFMPEGDLQDLDDGLYGEVIFGRELLSFLAVEASLGYLDADGRFGSGQFELWAIPLFVNARLSLPILFFEPYAGAGIGGIYADYEAGSLFAEDDLLMAWDAFIGVEVGLGNLAVGAEYKYIKSEDTENGFAIEGGVASLFLSLPF